MGSSSGWLNFLLSLCLGFDDLGQSNLDRDGSVLDVESIELLEALLLVLLVVELDESISLASVVVLLDNVSLLDGEVQIGNEFGERIVIEAEGQVGNKEEGIGLASLSVVLLGSLCSRLSGLSRFSGLSLSTLRSGLSGLSRFSRLSLSTLSSLGSRLVVSRGSVCSSSISFSLSLWSRISRLSLSSLSRLFITNSIGLFASLSRDSGLSLSSFSLLSVGTLLSFLGFLDQFDIDLSTVNILVVEGLDGSVGSFLRFHFDESVSERSGSTSDDVDIDNCSSVRKVSFQFRFFGLE